MRCLVPSISTELSDALKYRTLPLWLPMQGNPGCFAKTAKDQRVACGLSGRFAPDFGGVPYGCACHWRRFGPCPCYHIGHPDNPAEVGAES